MRRRNRALFVVIIFLLCTFLFLGINSLHKVADKSDISFEENDTDIVRDEDEQIDWRLILVNASHKIPENYEITLLTLSNGRKIDERIYPDLQEMFDDARVEGVYPKVGEGYRTREEQEEIMENKIRTFEAEGHSHKQAVKLAKEWVAEPGTSEHELGLALDINAADGEEPWDVYTWLANNAYKYGFILRYPQGKEAITGIDYEPWHYRYVGREAAANMYNQGLTLEEYLQED